MDEDERQEMLVAVRVRSNLPAAVVSDSRHDCGGDPACTGCARLAARLYPNYVAERHSYDDVTALYFRVPDQDAARPAWDAYRFTPQLQWLEEVEAGTETPWHHIGHESAELSEARWEAHWQAAQAKKLAQLVVEHAPTRQAVARQFREALADGHLPSLEELRTLSDQRHIPELSGVRSHLRSINGSRYEAAFDAAVDHRQRIQDATQDIEPAVHRLATATAGSEQERTLKAHLKTLRRQRTTETKHLERLQETAQQHLAPLQGFIDKVEAERDADLSAAVDAAAAEEVRTQLLLGWPEDEGFCPTTMKELRR